MDLFHQIPPEILEEMFEYFVISREFKRAMRLRLVSRKFPLHHDPLLYLSIPSLTQFISTGQFKNYVDNAIFRLRLLDQFVDGHNGIVLKLPSTHGLPRVSFLNLVYQYLAYQAWKGRLTTSCIGRVYRAAQTLCQMDGDVGEETITTCVLSLLPLAVSDWRFAGHPFQETGTESRECTDTDLKDDVAIAAVYLGRNAYVKDLIAQGINFFWSPPKRKSASYVFGNALPAAVHGGDLDMVKLLLSSQAEQGATDSDVEGSHELILERAARFGKRDLFHFALDNITIPTLPETAVECRASPYISLLERALCTPWPDNYERAIAILGPRSLRYHPGPGRGGTPSAWLARAARGRPELVRYFLSKGVTPNDVLCREPAPGLGNPSPYAWPRDYDRPLLGAIKKRHELIVKILLEAGADPTLQRPVGGLLRIAAMKRSVAIAKMLLERGLDPNEGRPPPIVAAVFKEDIPMFRLLREHGAKLDTLESGGWALTVARQFGLDSMADLLIREGVDEDMAFEWGGGAKEMYYGWDGPKSKSP